MHHNINLPLKSFYYGFKVDVAIQRNELCPECNGTGAAQDAKLLVCPVCKGAKTNSFNHRHVHSHGFHQTVTVNCKNCGGSGEIASDPCPRCLGKKVIDGKKTVSLGDGAMSDVRLL